MNAVNTITSSPLTSRRSAVVLAPLHSASRLWLFVFPRLCAGLSPRIRFGARPPPNPHRLDLPTPLQKAKTKPNEANAVFENRVHSNSLSLPMIRMRTPLKTVGFVSQKQVLGPSPLFLPHFKELAAYHIRTRYNVNTKLYTCDVARIQEDTARRPPCRSPRFGVRRLVAALQSRPRCSHASMRRAPAFAPLRPASAYPLEKPLSAGPSPRSVANNHRPHIKYLLGIRWGSQPRGGGAHSGFALRRPDPRQSLIRATQSRRPQILG